MISYHVEDQICTVVCKPKMVHEEVSEMRIQLEPILNDPDIDAVLFDFKEVRTIDSSAIGTIISICRMFLERRAQGKNLEGPVILALVAVSTYLMDTFSMTVFSKALDFFPDERSARRAMADKLSSLP